MLKWIIIYLLVLITLTLFGIFYDSKKSSKSSRITSSAPTDFHTSTTNMPEEVDPPTPATPLSFDLSLESPVIEPDILIPPDIPPFVKWHEYKVKGKNPATNRFKTCVVVAKEGTTENDIGIKSGFNEPYSIALNMESSTEHPPSEEQISLATDLHISIPKDCSSVDLSCLISKQFGQDAHDYVSNGLIDLAGELGFCLSPYISSITAADIIYPMLDRHELFAFYIYLIYCIKGNHTIENFHTNSYEKIFIEFANQYENDESLYKSIQSFNIIRFSQEQKVDGRNHKRAYLYNLACNFLSENIPDFQ